MAAYQEVEAPTASELGPLVSAALVAFHATPPHCPHELVVSFEDNYPTPPEQNELVVKCLKCVTEIRTYTRIELVGAIVICMHASHEAHPLEFSYGGRTFRAAASS
jgi:hypothetical protein